MNPKIFVNDDNIPLETLKKKLLRKQIIIEANKNYIKKNNRNTSIINGFVFNTSKSPTVTFGNIEIKYF